MLVGVDYLPCGRQDLPITHIIDTQICRGDSHLLQHPIATQPTERWETMRECLGVRWGKRMGDHKSSPYRKNLVQTALSSGGRGVWYVILVAYI